MDDEYCSEEEARLPRMKSTKPPHIFRQRLFFLEAPCSLTCSPTCSFTRCPGRNKLTNKYGRDGEGGGVCVCAANSPHIIAVPLQDEQDDGAQGREKYVRQTGLVVQPYAEASVKLTNAVPVVPTISTLDGGGGGAARGGIGAGESRLLPRALRLGVLERRRRGDTAATAPLLLLVLVVLRRRVWPAIERGARGGGVGDGDGRRERPVVLGRGGLVGREVHRGVAWHGEL